uniref:Uncharacterized protein n=1 Tax=Arundo donax TaxID=35708 RepID=A0A0A9T0T4_ARUDO
MNSATLQVYQRNNSVFYVNDCKEERHLLSLCRSK